MKTFFFFFIEDPTFYRDSVACYVSPLALNDSTVFQLASRVKGISKLCQSGPSLSKGQHYPVDRSLSTG